MKHTAQLVDIQTLKEFPGNPRRGNVDAIAESLQAFGQYRPVVVKLDTMVVIAGNHTLMAARKLGWSDIWATFIDCDEQTAKRINLADNRLPELGGYDAEALAAMLGELPQLEGTGWTDYDLQKLLQELTPPGEVGTGDGDPGPGITEQLGVVIFCSGTEHQRKLHQALVAAAQGRYEDLKQTLQDAEIQMVTL